MNTNDRRKAGRRNQLLAAVMAVAIGLTWGQAGAWAGQPRSPAGSQPASSEQTERTLSTEGEQPPQAPPAEDGYAAREAQAKNLENFKGGDVVIITTTTVLIILVVILIIVII